MTSNRKVAVAMSGGVDSSTTAFLLKEQGFEVVGVTAIMHDMENAQTAVQNAKKVADKLNIEHYALDLRKEFNENVITYFENDYKNALTPNPCAVCNKKIKWGALKNFAASQLGAKFYATGHYVNCINENGIYKILRSADIKKDQTYMLFMLSQQDLSNTLFPLGDFTKDKVREIAEKANLPTAKSKDSQDICFIVPPDTTKKYLMRKYNKQEGYIVEEATGKVLGKHTGHYYYTIGQRKGIGIAAKAPLYVTDIDAENNVIYVGFKEELAKQSVEISDVNWQQDEFSKEPFDAFVKIRYNSPAKKAKVIPDSTANNAFIEFENQEYAVTPGQAAVFYDINNKFLIGGGWINKA